MRPKTWDKLSVNIDHVYLRLTKFVLFFGKLSFFQSLAWEKFYKARKTAKETREKKREYDKEKARLDEE